MKEFQVNQRINIPKTINDWFYFSKCFLLGLSVRVTSEVYSCSRLQENTFLHRYVLQYLPHRPVPEVSNCGTFRCWSCSVAAHIINPDSVQNSVHVGDSYFASFTL